MLKIKRGGKYSKRFKHPQYSPGLRLLLFGKEIRNLVKRVLALHPKRKVGIQQAWYHFDYSFTMKFSQSQWLYLSAAASFLAVGIPYWNIPYSQLDLPESLLTPAVIVVILSALLLRMYTEVPFWRTTLMIGLAVGAAVMARILFEVMQDPTSHNLWPFEVVIALITGSACAAAGALAGSIFAKTLSRSSRR